MPQHLQLSLESTVAVQYKMIELREIGLVRAGIECYTQCTTS